MPRSTALTGTLRHIPSLKEKLLSQAKTEQCRAHGLMLPPDWSKQGVFEMRSSGPGDVVFFHRYNETARPWPLALRLRKSDGELVDLAELTIEHNFYEDSAEVKSDQCLESFRVANLGTFDDMAPDSKRRRLGANLAIEDGGDPDGAQQLCLPAPATSPPSSGGSVRSGSLSGSRLMLPSTPRPSSRMLGGGVRVPPARRAAPEVRLPVRQAPQPPGPPGRPTLVHRRMGCPRRRAQAIGPRSRMPAATEPLRRIQKSRSRGTPCRTFSLRRKRRATSRATRNK